MKFVVATLRHFGKWSAPVLLSTLLCFGYSPSQSSNKKPKHTSAKTSTVSKSGKASQGHAHSRKGKRVKKASWRRGQQKIDPDRAQQIQEVLIRAHYLTGEPTGTWDQRSQNAMLKFQADNGWQTKIVPDSRALIKLGLGPSNDHLLNPESAMTSPLQPASTSEQPAPAISAERTPSSKTPVTPVSSSTTERVSNPQQ